MEELVSGMEIFATVKVILLAAAIIIIHLVVRVQPILTPPIIRYIRPPLFLRQLRLRVRVVRKVAAMGLFVTIPMAGVIIAKEHVRTRLELIQTTARVGHQGIGIVPVLGMVALGAIVTARLEDMIALQAGSNVPTELVCQSKEPVLQVAVFSKDFLSIFGGCKCDIK